MLAALAAALQLDEAEHAHLFDLARAVNPVAPRRQRPPAQRVRPAVLRVLESISAPALAYNSRHDYLAANQLGRALYAPVVARDLVASLRPEAGRRPLVRVADEGLTIAVFGAEPASRPADQLALLGSWAATPAPGARRGRAAAEPAF